MSELKKELKIYQTSIDKIFSIFGIKNAYGEIDVRTTVKWNLNGNDSVRWLEKGELYSNDVLRDPLYADGHMMVYVDNGCGDRYYQVFDMKLKDKNLKEE